MKEFIDKLLERLEEYKENTGETLINLGERKAIKNITIIITELAEEYNGGWIPCSEKLPDKTHLRYMVSVLDRMNRQYVTTMMFDGKLWSQVYPPFSCLECQYVIAWQPLPKPYNME